MENYEECRSRSKSCLNKKYKNLFVPVLHPKESDELPSPLKLRYNDSISDNYSFDTQESANEEASYGISMIHSNRKRNTTKKISILKVLECKSKKSK